MQAPWPTINSSTCYITTLAGNGSTGTSCDGGLSEAAVIESPTQLTFMKGTGDLLIASKDQHVVRIVFAATGIVATFAGTAGVPGFAGDGGYAINARLSGVTGVLALDDGSVLIGERNNNRVRIVWPNNTIGTWAGTGSPSSTGDGFFRTSATIDGAWKLTQLQQSGDVIISDLGCGCLRRVSARTGLVSTFVGPPGRNSTITVSSAQPHDLVAIPGKSDALLMTDFASSQIYLLNTAARTAFLVMSGVGGSGQLYHALSGSVIIANYASHNLKAFTVGSAAATLFAGTGSTNVSNGNGDGGLPRAAVVIGPSGIAWHPTTGAIVINEHTGNRVRLVSAGCLPPAPVVSVTFAPAHVLTSSSSFKLPGNF